MANYRHEKGASLLMLLLWLLLLFLFFRFPHEALPGVGLFFLVAHFLPSSLALSLLSFPIHRTAFLKAHLNVMILLLCTRFFGESLSAAGFLGPPTLGAAVLGRMLGM